MVRRGTGPCKAGHKALQDGTRGLARPDTRPCKTEHLQRLCAHTVLVDALQPHDLEVARQQLLVGDERADVLLHVVDSSTRRVLLGPVVQEDLKSPIRSAETCLRTCV